MHKRCSFARGAMNRTVVKTVGTHGMARWLAGDQRIHSFDFCKQLFQAFPADVEGWGLIQALRLYGVVQCMCSSLPMFL